MIQSSINQLLTTVGAAANFSPEVQKMNQKKKLNKQESILNEQLESAMSGAVQYDLENDPEGTNAELQSRQMKNIAGIYDLQHENLKKQFELDPTTAGYTRMASAQTQAAEMRRTANEIVKKKIANAIEQDNDFKNYRSSIILGSDAKPLKMEVKNGKE